MNSITLPRRPIARFSSTSQPTELLGLTATPERSDGLPLLNWFDNRIAAELRLWDAIDQQRLSPFVYYGIHDGLDLRQVPWRRGGGYDVEGLSNLLTANDAWARHVLAQVVSRVDDPRRMRALGFCVSVEHARFMARVFREAGVASTAVWADSPDEERAGALADLAARRINVLFSVDLFNEGIDIPAVDTLLLLRPTDSPTLFLQQLGRGLRRLVGKTVCTVLDFVGHHRKEFRFDRRFRALLGGSRKDLEKQIIEGFPFLPAGCHIELDHVATELVLENIRSAVPSRWPEKVEELRLVAGGDNSITLQRFLDETGLELEDVYTGRKTFSDLRADAGLSVLPAGPKEEVLRQACGRLLHIDDFLRIDTYRRLLSEGEPPDLTITVSCVNVSSCACSWRPLRTARSARQRVSRTRAKSCGRIRRFERSCWICSRSSPHASITFSRRWSGILMCRCWFTLATRGLRSSLRSALASTRKSHRGKRACIGRRMRRADLFAFTLDKTTGQFSPTTRYRDYAVSRDLIHWESQSATRADSETGRRYQQHEALGSSIMLFARLRSDDRAFWFLGPARYVKHESELPMAITWRLDHSLPGDLFAQFAAAVA